MSQEKSLLDLFRDWKKEKSKEMICVNDNQFFDEIRLNDYCKANLIDLHKIYNSLAHLTDAVYQLQCKDD